MLDSVVYRSMASYTEMFSDISDDEFCQATQLLESSLFSTNDSLFREEELSYDEIISLTPVLQNPYLGQSAADETSTVARDAANVKTGLAENVNDRRFREPVSEQDVSKVRDSRFAPKTVKNATWAVTLFGQWRANRNVRCFSGVQIAPFTSTSRSH